MAFFVWRIMLISFNYSLLKMIKQLHFCVFAYLLLQSWILISTHSRNVAKKCFSANVPKLLIFGLLVRIGTINDFSH